MPERRLPYEPALRKPVIPAQAGIQGFLVEVDSRLCGNDGLKKAVHLSFARNQDPG